MDKEFFDTRLLYYGLDEFFHKRIIIKTILQCKNNKDIYLYRMYVYSRGFINDTWKDYIWEYLNNDISDLQFRLLYSDFKNKRKHI